MFIPTIHEISTIREIFTLFAWFFHSLIIFIQLKYSSKKSFSTVLVIIIALIPGKILYRLFKSLNLNLNFFLLFIILRGCVFRTKITCFLTGIWKENLLWWFQKVNAEKLWFKFDNGFFGKGGNVFFDESGNLTVVEEFSSKALVKALGEGVDETFKVFLYL